MKIEKYFENEKLIEKEIKRYEREGSIRKTIFGEQLCKAHIEKANHNLEYVKYISKNEKFNDWQVIGLYYSVYHAALAMVSKKEYSVKNHRATILLIIREYTQITKEEIKLIEELKLENEDVKIYTELKEEREKASYSTNVEFRNEKVKELKTKTIKFVNKAKEIIEKI
jgi:uncharacterized protein (UPF0332 family)